MQQDIIANKMQGISAQPDLAFAISCAEQKFADLPISFKIVIWNRLQQSIGGEINISSPVAISNDSHGSRHAPPAGIEAHSRPFPKWTTKFSQQQKAHPQPRGWKG